MAGEACPVCGHNSGKYALIQGRCHRCQKKHPKISHLARVGEYTGALAELVKEFKFHRQSRLDNFLGGMLGHAIAGDLQLRDVDLFIPIPLHWRRKLARTYNQAELLTRSAAGVLGEQGRRVRLSHDLLRIRHTRPQSSLAASHRIVNLHGAFAVRPDAGYAGRHLCLIDDVTTTGTTLRVAASALLDAGAARVSAAVLAVAAND